MCGGLFLDRLGGYQGVRGVLRACSMSTLLSFLAVCCAVPLIWIENFAAIIVLVWCLSQPYTDPEIRGCSPLAPRESQNTEATCLKSPFIFTFSLVGSIPVHFERYIAGCSP